MTKFASLKKNLLENYHRKKKSGENSVIQQKHAVTFPDLHSLIFHSIFISHFLDISKMGN